ncbi:hypothetical protein [Alteribacter populi]|uniref:hypothetical protein n=1 Tax=Alteribacter populi TaxID=2011011 RepID=UPI000BBAB0C1|nr:hypothetical protein [Alteribacter populi]
MDSNHFDQKMKELKEKYNTASPTTSAQEIFQGVQLEKKRKRKLVYWPVYAAVVSLLFVGGILMGSFLMSDNNLTQDDPTLPDDSTSHVPGDVEDPEEDPHPGDIDDLDEEVDQPVERIYDRPETINHEFVQEGMDEEYEYVLYVNEDMRFSSYIEEQFEVEESATSDDSETVHIYSMYGAVEREEASISVTRYPSENERSLDELEELHHKEEKEGQGYTEILDRENPFEEVDRHSVWSHPEGEITFYALKVHEGDIYEINVNMPGHWTNSEFRYFESVKVFVNELMFE